MEFFPAQSKQNLLSRRKCKEKRALPFFCFLLNGENNISFFSAYNITELNAHTGSISVLNLVIRISNSVNGRSSYSKMLLERISNSCFQFERNFTEKIFFVPVHIFRYHLENISSQKQSIEFPLMLFAATQGVVVDQTMHVDE